MPPERALLDTEANSESERVKIRAHVDMRIAGREATWGAASAGHDR